MTDSEGLTARARRAQSVVRVRPLRLQLMFAVVTALTLTVLSAFSRSLWDDSFVWISSGAVVLATVLAIVVRRLRRGIYAIALIVPAIDLAAVLTLMVDVQAPRILAMLAVVPAFWLGLVGRRVGVGIAFVGGVSVAVAMGLRLPTSTDLTLTANAVGVVLAPLALAAAAWFADSFSSTVERQQQAIARREHEKLAIARERETDGQLLDAIFETARVGLLLFAADGSVRRANPTLLQHPALGGRELGAVIAQSHFLDLETRRALPSAESAFARAAQGASFDNEAFWFDRPGHELYAITMSSRPLLVEGELRGSIASVDDVTTYMRMLEDRDDFVALVSHELRTPLTSMTGYLELALDEPLPPNLESWLLAVQRNATRLRLLVEDLLLAGEMSRGDVTLHRAPVELDAIARDALQALAHRAEHRNITLTMEPAPRVGVIADRLRIGQVIENLISNGIKYTRVGGNVRVRVAVEGANAVVSVVDDGHGIDAVEASNVFERFYRSASARASGIQGAGLGLWICRMIVHAHGGVIRFDSMPGQGSVVAFRLPLGDE